MKLTCIIFLFLISISAIYAQDEANYDESKIPAFTLPELLVLKNGKAVNNSKTWMKKRRPEILADFENEMFGKIPGDLKINATGIVEEDKNVFGGKATRRQVSLIVNKGGSELKINLLLYIPNALKKAPAFVGLNFKGNQTICNDPDILLAESWVLNDSDMGITHHKATEESRGGKAGRWQVEKLINSGFALATACCGDIDPDKNDFSDGPHPFFYTEGQTNPAPNEWGTIAAWSWGLSRIMDYLETVEEINTSKVVVIGHSRLGKTSLWAGATDQRFSAVISNNSGCGGAALSRRAIGETVKRINTVFPHWFNDNFQKYNSNENQLPIDQHGLIALIAPRPVYVASAFEDKWADPKGEYLSAYYASQVYELFGLKGLSSPEQPPLNTPVLNTVSYHIREGKHNVTEYDWGQYIKFAKTFLN